MTSPLELDVLGTRFSVLWAPIHEDCLGDSTVHLRLIRVDTSVSREVQIETFYHELVHTLLDHLGLSSLLKDGTEEAFAQGLGMALAFVTKNNILPTL